MNQALYSSARPQDSGVAAGIFQTSRYVGAIVATTILGLLFSGGTTAGTLARGDGRRDGARGGAPVPAGVRAPRAAGGSGGGRGRTGVTSRPPVSAARRER